MHGPLQARPRTLVAARPPALHKGGAVCRLRQTLLIRRILVRVRRAARDRRMASRRSLVPAIGLAPARFAPAKALIGLAPVRLAPPRVACCLLSILLLTSGT